MKKILISSLIAASFLASGWQASAVEIANGTYSFIQTEAGGSDAAGSTVTFNNDVPVSWDIHITSLTYPAELSDTYTPLNSTISLGEYGFIGPDAFALYLKADVVTSYGDPSGSIGWNVDGVSYIYDNPVYGAPLDPTGTWVLPDGGTTAGLLGAGLIGLSVLRRKLA